MGGSLFSILISSFFSIFIQKEAVVAEILVNSLNGLSRNFIFSQELYDWEAQSVTYLFDFLQFIYFVRKANDKRVWLLESSSKFTSKSFFNLSQSEFSFSHEKIWKPVSPPRVKAFSWTAILYRINTTDMLQRRRPFNALSPQ